MTEHQRKNLPTNWASKMNTLRQITTERLPPADLPWKRPPKLEGCARRQTRHQPTGRSQYTYKHRRLHKMFCFSFLLLSSLKDKRLWNEIIATLYHSVCNTRTYKLCNSSRGRRGVHWGRVCGSLGPVLQTVFRRTCNTSSRHMRIGNWINEENSKSRSKPFLLFSFDF